MRQKIWAIITFIGLVLDIKELISLYKGINFLSIFVIVGTSLLFIGIVLLVVDRDYRGIKEQKQKHREEQEAYLNKLEDAIIEFRQKSEKLFEESQKCSPEEYMTYLQNDNLYNKYISDSKYRAISMSLANRHINPRLQELQDKPNYRNLKARLLECNGKVNHSALKFLVNRYVWIYQVATTKKLLIIFAKKYSEDLDFNDQKQMTRALAEWDEGLLSIYDLIMEYLNIARRGI